MRPWKTIQSLAFEGIKEGLDTKDIIKKVKKHFKESAIDRRAVSHYRCILKKMSKN